MLSAGGFVLTGRSTASHESVLAAGAIAPLIRSSQINLDGRKLDATGLS